MLTAEHKQRRVELSQQCLCRYEKDGDEFLKKVVTRDETWVCQYEPESKRQSMEWKHVGSPVKKFKSQRSTRKVMLTDFWDMQGPITISFLEKGSTVSSANYCELLRQVKKDIKNKRRGISQKESSCIMTTQDLTQQPERCRPSMSWAGSCPLIPLTAQTLPLQTFTCLVPLKRSRETRSMKVTMKSKML
ncbi:hypothetical protein BsWGS_06675 [Bradybaena similaris]